MLPLSDNEMKLSLESFEVSPSGSKASGGSPSLKLLFKPSIEKRLENSEIKLLTQGPPLLDNGLELSWESFGVSPSGSKASGGSPSLKHPIEKRLENSEIK